MAGKHEAIGGLSGDELRAWLMEMCGAEAVDSIRPVIEEMCCLADRLREIRRRLADKSLSSKELAQLVSAETKVSGALVRLWKTAGLADPEPESDSER